LEIAVQPLQGVLEPDSQAEFVRACEKADVIGGLPSKDRPQPEKHLDFILSLARDLNKPVDVHVDQENNPDEVETELLALKTIEFGLHGRVRAVHGISLAAHDDRYQKRVIGMCRDAGIAFIVCPSAALSMRQLSDRTAPIHNSIAPVPALLHSGVPVVMGVDNIYDLFMPLVDGDMWVECRLLMEATRHYDIEVVSTIATDKSGFATTG
jgi:cytosine/adenosine deaminase-related metal-dependent hydrolase